MLSLNIKSSNYMCLDIDQDSVIHKHLVKKITDLTNKWDQGWNNPILSSPTEDPDCDESHKLIMLPSFHISLEAPNPELDHVGDSITVRNEGFNIRAVIGEIILADIHISEKDSKKSAWIPLHPDLIDEFLPHHHNHRHYARPDDPDAFDHKLLHISLANLTGNPHDSIARPEDCIINTIKA